MASPWLSLLSSPFRRPLPNALIACLGALAIVTILNVALTFYTIHTVKDLLPGTHEWSRFTICSENATRARCCFEAYIGDDFPSDLPIEIPLAGLRLEAGEDHFSLYNDDEWGTLFPSDGFVRLGPNDRTFLVSLFHQLHCLDVVRVGYLTNGTHAFEHIQHCLRYLRQILTCHADTTLEDDIPQFADGSWTHTANGVGSVHRCKDWTVLRQWVADHPSLPLEYNTYVAPYPST